MFFLITPSQEYFFFFSNSIRQMWKITYNKYCKVSILVLLSNILESPEHFQILYSIVDFEVIFLSHHIKANPRRWHVSQFFSLQKVEGRKHDFERLVFQVFLFFLCHRTAGLLHLSLVIEFTSMLVKLLGLSLHINRKENEQGANKNHQLMQESSAETWTNSKPSA